MLEVGLSRCDKGVTFSGCLKGVRAGTDFVVFKHFVATLSSEGWPVAGTVVINVKLLNYKTTASCAPTELPKHTLFGKLIRISGALRRIFTWDPKIANTYMPSIP